MQEEIYYSDRYLSDHMQNEERAGSLAHRLVSELEELVRYADDDTRYRYRQLLDEAEKLYMFEKGMCSAIDEMNAAFVDAAARSRQIMEENLGDAKRTIHTYSLEG